MKSPLFRVINIVAHPSENHIPELYMNALKEIAIAKILIRLSRKSKGPKAGIITKFELLHPDEDNDIYIGSFWMGTHYGDGTETFDTETLEQSTVDELRKFLIDPKEYTFWYSMSKHRFIIPKALPIRPFTRYLITAFQKLRSPVEVSVTPVKSKQSVEKIINSPYVVELVISIHYTNNDNNDGFAEAIDREMKKSNTSTLCTKITADRGKRIDIKSNSYLGGLLRLSRENGFAKATLKDKDDNEMPSLSTKEDYVDLTIQTNELDRIQPSDISKMVDDSLEQNDQDE